MSVNSDQQSANMGTDCPLPLRPCRIYTLREAAPPDTIGELRTLIAVHQTATEQGVRLAALTNIIKLSLDASCPTVRAHGAAFIGNRYGWSVVG